MKKIIVLWAFMVYAAISSAQILPPAAPTGLAGSQILLNNQIRLTWTPPAGVFAGYKVYYQRGSGVVDSVRIGKIAVDTLKNLVYNSVYTVYIKTFKLGTLPADTLYSPPTTPLNITLVGLVAPTPRTEPALNTPTQVSVIIDDTNIYETGFEIEVTESGTNNTKTVTAPAGGNSDYRPVGGLKPKTTYAIRVRAKSNALSGPWSSIIYSTTKVDFPPAAVLSSDKNCPTLVHVMWTVNTRKEDVSEYIVQKSVDNVNFTEFRRFGPSVSDLYDQDITPGKTVFYKIYTNNSTGSTPSQVLTVTPKTYQNPSPVLGLVPNKQAKYDNYLTFGWTNGPEEAECGLNKVDEIIVLIKKDNETQYTEYTRLPPLTRVVKIEGLKPKTVVTVGIKTLSNKGLVSDMVIAKDTTWGPPYAPQNLKLVSTEDALGNTNNGLNWQYDFIDVDYYKIERSTSEGPYVEIGKITSNFKYFNDMNIEEGVLYSYRVKAGNFVFGDGEPSNVIGPLLQKYTKAPNAPVGLVSKVNGTKVSLTWRDESVREENNVLEKSLDGGTTFILVASLGRNITSYNDENVIAGKKYLYRVKAVNTIGESAYSNLAEASIAASGSLNTNTLGITVFPNPAINELKIEYSENLIGESINIKIIDKMNRIVKSQSFKADNSTIYDLSISNLTSGLYTVVIVSGKETVSKKLFKY